MKPTQFIVECPHCLMMIEITEINCAIFRHGVYKKNNKQINPHMSKADCDKLFNQGKIYGCGKPFKIIQNIKLDETSKDDGQSNETLKDVKSEYVAQSDDNIKDDVAKDDVAKDDVAQDDVAQEDIAKDDMSINDRLKEDIAKDDMSINDRLKEDIAKIKPIEVISYIAVVCDYI